MGVTLAELPVGHRPRTLGRSKYGLGRTLRVVLDLFTVKFLVGYGTRPAHFFGLIGLALGALGSAILVYLAWLKFVVDEAIGGRPLLQAGVLLSLAGLIFVSLGLIGELLVRIYHESQGKPIYVVREARPTEAAAAEPDAVMPAR
jgi:hypothetical protein